MIAAPVQAAAERGEYDMILLLTPWAPAYLQDALATRYEVQLEVPYYNAGQALVVYVPRRQ